MSKLAHAGASNTTPDGFASENARSTAASSEAPSCTSTAPASASLTRSEEHTSELQSRFDLVCRLLLEKKKKSVGNGFTYLICKKFVSIPSALRSSIPSRIAPFVDPQPTKVIGADVGPCRMAFFELGMTCPASSILFILFFIIRTRRSAASVMWPYSSCSSPVVQNTPPFRPGLALGEIPSSVNWYLL